MLNSRLLENNEHHWMHLLFIAHVLIDLQSCDQAMDIYHDLLKINNFTFKDWLYLHSQIATAHHNKRGKNGKVNFYLIIYKYVHHYLS